MASGTWSHDAHDRAGRFKALALPHLDNVYTLARYLLGSAADADDAVQECYLRALQHFDTFRGPEIKPWLFAILRNACHTIRTRQKGSSPHAATALEDDALETAEPLWSDGQDTPEAQVLRRHDAETVRAMIAALPDAFREVVVLREIEDLSYREIAEIVDAPIGTVMSRLARARSLLRAAWIAAAGEEEKAS
ncbi:MAG TPA: sigma-70 family RNA polymerase sigma factor [Xanthobacteraceae bacterium]|nr:sigma-70 family RNA polymerase sigma factor [Xanthobacteraceae bacterium]